MTSYEWFAVAALIVASVSPLTVVWYQRHTTLQDRKQLSDAKALLAQQETAQQARDAQTKILDALAQIQVRLNEIIEP